MVWRVGGPWSVGLYSSAGSVHRAISQWVGMSLGISLYASAVCLGGLWERLLGRLYLYVGSGTGMILLMIGSGDALCGMGLCKGRATIL